MTLKLGSSGDAVTQLEQRLTVLGLYNGRIDGSYGGGVQAAVRKFQATNGLEVDGAVGPSTWKALFPNEPRPVNPLLTAPIGRRCLALTGTFETSAPPPGCFSGLTGDFDKQGISFGALQWNFGQGSLQPMLKKCFADHPGVAADVFHENLATLQAILQLPIPQQLAWTRTIQNARCQIAEPWKGMFLALGRTPEFQAIQAAAVESTLATARQLCKRFEVNSHRALALMFDIATQNGSISPTTEALIRAGYAKIPAGKPSEVEVARLQVIANRRAEASNPTFVEDVRKRKLCIANGQGVVHGLPYDLAEQFGIDLSPLNA